MYGIGSYEGQTVEEDWYDYEDVRREQERQEHDA